MFSIWWVLGALVVGFYLGIGALALMIVTSKDPDEPEGSFVRPLEHTGMMFK
jgi:hypothetical protein